MSDAPILSARDLAQSYLVGGGLMRAGFGLQALRGVSFDLAPGRTLAVVGESGCGKSTLARILTMIERPTGGRLLIEGSDPVAADRAEKRQLRQKVQIVFQNPYASLNPRAKIRSILEEPLVINTAMTAAERRAAALSMMARVGLRPEHALRYPHMFSGGQRQRIAIARALMLRPRIIVLDEPVSALDLSIQAQVLNLLVELQREFNLAYLFISHNLSVVRHLAEEVLVMYLGRAVEHGPREAIYRQPLHPYTRALLASSPVADPAHRRARLRIPGELPSPLNPPAGCAFHPRCPLANDRCRQERPELIRQDGRLVACHAVEEGRMALAA
ncbi:dipeptide transport system ATP-binding protein [Arboricoccus pini]|uniref:Dipeptide transport system ATP-binding protein n=1 Tax=Arboricoccus pini TaxID=1963835 RepID=A0A212QYR2_9PROT|nr:dipeptide ABC transporter ATP-binding protein [Arboricoccus pini]SNB64716.1 dipeptide transport system ATP-binding protein [Arboricoccus pini]